MLGRDSTPCNPILQADARGRCASRANERTLGGIFSAEFFGRMSKAFEEDEKQNIIEEQHQTPKRAERNE